MKYLISLMLLAASVAFSDLESKSNADVVIKNTTKETIAVWINGEKMNLDAKHSLIFVCIPTEKVEVQIRDSIQLVMCGSKIEVQQ